MNKTVLTVDIGTSSLKAALIDVSGTVVSSARCRFPNRKRTPKDWLTAFHQAVQALSPIGEVSALVVSGNGPTLIATDANDRPLSLLLWNDPISKEAKKRAGSPVHAGSGSVAGEAHESRSIFIPRMVAFRSMFPESYAASRWILSGPEYLIYRLTGNAVTILPESRFERAYWTPGDLDAAGLDRAKCPPFVAPGTIAGMTGEAAASLSNFGLPSGLPVIAGGPDFIVAIIGTGTLEHGKACDRAGTSEGLNVCISAQFKHPLIRTLPSVIEPLWNASYLLSETGARFHDYRKQSGQAKKTYPEIMAEIEASPIFPPDGGSLHPGRMIVESIGFSVRKGIELLKVTTGISPVYYLSGGQARNEIWNQLKANITGSVFALTSTPDGELLGDAIIGFTALGDYGSIREGAKEMVRVKKFYEPDPELHVYYSEKFARHENL